MTSFFRTEHKRNLYSHENFWSYLKHILAKTDIETGKKKIQSAVNIMCEV